MIVYGNNKDGTRNKARFPEYFEMSREEFAEFYKSEVKRREQSRLPLNWVYSWYVDELQEKIVELAIVGNLEGIKKILIEQEKDPQYLATIRFCNDGFSTMKYEKTAVGPLDGYGLLNIAIFFGHAEMVQYLVHECGINPNEQRYANPIWTAALPTQFQQEASSLDRVKFNILRDLSENPGIDFVNYKSGKVEDTVFHLAVRMPDHDLRNEALHLFKTEAGGIASQYNKFGRVGNTPILNLCRSFGMRAADNDYNSASPINKIELTEFFLRDLELLKSCGGFNDYATTRDYERCLGDMPEFLKQPFIDSFALSNISDVPSGSARNSSSEKPRDSKESKDKGPSLV